MRVQEAFGVVVHVRYAKAIVARFRDFETIMPMEVDGDLFSLFFPFIHKRGSATIRQSRQPRGPGENSKNII